MSLPTIFNPATCTRKGLCPLDSHSIYFEQHGNGPIHVLFVNGLNTSSFAWNFQVEDLLAKEQMYSVVVFDNRGVGNSGYPTGRYTTSTMAEDIVVLLNYLGWTGRHVVNLVGVSLGGMIAQEVAFRIPDRIASLVLAVTTPGGRPIWNNLPPWKGLVSLLRLFLTPDPAKKVAIVMGTVFPASWIDKKDETDPAGRTNRQVQTENYIRRTTLTRKQRLIGHASQLLAGLTHHVSPARLRLISSTIPKVVIVCGDEDDLVDVRNSWRLKEAMPEADFVQWRETGHGIYTQRPKEFHDLLVRTFNEAKEKIEHS